jgi:hypothetical protein
LLIDCCLEVFGDLGKNILRRKVRVFGQEVRAKFKCGVLCSKLLHLINKKISLLRDNKQLLDCFAEAVMGDDGSATA